MVAAVEIHVAIGARAHEEHLGGEIEETPGFEDGLSGRGLFLRARPQDAGMPEGAVTALAQQRSLDP